MSKSWAGMGLYGRLAPGCAALLVWFSAGGVAIAHADTASAGQMLSQKPSWAASSTQFQAGTSTMAPSLSISYRALGDAANAAADKFSGPRSGTTRIGCTPAQVGAPNAKIGLPQDCVDFDWRITASRNGTITARRDGQGIGFAIPVKFAGSGGFRGDAAKTLQLSKKDFAGSFVVTISGILKPDKNFCPKLDQAVTHFAWVTPPQIDLINNTCINVAGVKACFGPWKLPVGTMLTGEINRSLADQVDAINGKMACNDVRDALRKVWKPWYFPITLANSPTFYVNVDPKALSVPGVTVDDEGVNVAARLDVATSVTAKKPAEQPPPELPQNTPLDTQPGRFSLHVPLAVPYAILASAPSGRIVGKPIEGHGAAITPVKVEMFPSNGRLAIGVTFRADGPARLRGRTGTVWYTATPAVENGGHLIKLDDLTLTQKTNSPLWALRPALDGLPTAVGATYSYDLGPVVRDAQNKVREAIANPGNTGGARIAVANDDLRLGRIALLTDAFVVEGDFDADVTAALGEPGRQANAAP